jgi:hypothetical protein
MVTYTIGEYSDVQPWTDTVPCYLKPDADEIPLSPATKSERARLGWERWQGKRQLEREHIADREWQQENERRGLPDQKWIDEIDQRIVTLEEILHGKRQASDPAPPS